MTGDPQETYLPVVCPVCRTRMYARPDQVGSRLACPDCGTVCPVLAPVPAHPAPPRADPGEYGLSERGAFGDPTAVRTTPLPESNLSPGPAETGHRRPGEKDLPKSAASGRKRPLAVILVICPLCHTRMHPARSEQGKRIKCPDCGTVVTVPTEIDPPKPKTAPDLVIGQYVMGHAPAAASQNVDILVRSQLLPAPPPPTKPPRWSLLSGVFSFPWQREARLRWLYLTIGFLASGELLVFILHFSGLATGSTDAGGTGAGGLAVGALGIVLLWLLIWTGTFAAACLVSVTRETAAGIDQVEQWPESDWREWLWPALYLADVIGVASAVAYALVYALRWAFNIEYPAAELIFALTVSVTVPMLLLSIFDNGTVLRPFSWPVLRSLTRLPHYWLVFQLETLLPLAALAALSMLVLTGWAFYAALAFAPLAAAYVLIYARLLGRMAWQVGDLDERIRESREDKI